MRKFIILLALILFLICPALAQDTALVPATCGANGMRADDLAPMWALAQLNRDRNRYTGYDLTLADLQQVYAPGVPIRTNDSPEVFEWPYATRPAAGWGNTALVGRGQVSSHVIELWRPDGTARTVWVYQATGEPTVLLWPSDAIMSVGHPPEGCIPVTFVP